MTAFQSLCSIICASLTLGTLAPALAADPNKTVTREIPVGSKQEDMQQVVNRVDELVNEMTNLTTNLKTAINPDELRVTMKQLNRTLENASKTLSPESGLNQTAQRSLTKLEDAIEQLRALAIRVNQGEGSVGMLLNDPVYANEVKEILKNTNRLVSRMGDVRLLVDIGAHRLMAHSGSRGFGKLEIWPNRGRFYLVGMSSDPRGKPTHTIETTTINGTATTVTDTLTNTPTDFLLTGMIGQAFLGERLDLSIGFLYGDGTVSAKLNLGNFGWMRDVRDLQLHVDLFSNSKASDVIDGRVTLTYRPWMATYIQGGLESFRQVNGTLSTFVGAGLAFEDQDIKLLFALR